MFNEIGITLQKKEDFHSAIKSYLKAIKLNKNSDKPTVIIANTIKGKGISFMENVPSWHHGKLTENTYQQAVQELEGK